MDFIRPATVFDALELAPTLRQEDASEIQAATGLCAAEVLVEGVLQSKPCFTLVSPTTGRVAALLGVNPVEPEVGRVWLLGSGEIVSHSRQFLRNSRPITEELNRQYPVLFNYVDARNTVHIAWLKWCGFTFIRLIPEHGFERRPFYEFVRIPTCANL